MRDSALVVLSGGQDSTTCLALAKQAHEKVCAITFDYGQRHSIEVQLAIEIANAMDCPHEVIPIGDILQSTSPLTDHDLPVGKYESVGELPSGIEPTFVPGRNILFAAIASNRMAALGCDYLYLGLCQEDESGYPDCRPAFANAMQQALGLGLVGDANALSINTPLMNLSKAETVIAAKEALGEQFGRIMGLTHTCYEGVRGGCGECHACLLRDRGFIQAGIDDPLWAIAGRNPKG